MVHSFKHQHVHILSRPDLAQHGGYAVVEESGAFPAASSESSNVCWSVLLHIVLAGDTVDYIVTGAWSKKAYEEAQKLGLKVTQPAGNSYALGALVQPCPGYIISIQLCCSSQALLLCQRLIDSRCLQINSLTLCR